jgi:drug/metabolite transporter (DMT)-like permease
VGVVVGLVGVGVLARYGTVAVDAAVLGAFALAFTAASLYAFCALYIRRRHAGTDPLVLAGSSQLGAAVVLAPLGIAAMPAAMPPLPVVLSLLALGIVCTGLAYALYFRLLSDIGSEKAVTNTFLVPVFAQLWGAIFLGEHLTLAGAIGFALVLIAIALVLELIPWRGRSRSIQPR